ncbi:MAG: orotate phosphoribosyltransferase [Ruminococcus sp.]|uniref:orotate phosphoribosyltransferase n=1 Tax=Ruminococcus sp. TaxID=41978 RepID=UPI0028737B2A|nr:orotate phosphoribosyltransferase [Ruminococcus sp.]MBQ3285147.1 orotate phosphoribosyltransferase [Ruminococcus sp.]
MANEFKIRTRNPELFLRVQRGHFATMHSHTNYYIDVTTQKFRMSEAKAVAKEIVSFYRTNTIIDTIICLDGTEVIGAFVAQELSDASFMNLNAHQTIYILSPEFIGNGQMVFRDNTSPMILNKHVLILAASVTTGKTALAAIDAIQYYGGHIVGVSSIFATVSECDGVPVTSIFNPNDLEDYQSYKPHRCPMCQNGERLEALVNSYGYSKL